MIEENVVRAAGAEYCMDEFEVVRNIENAGFAAKRRNMHYERAGRSDLSRARACRACSSWPWPGTDGRAGEADDLEGLRGAERGGPPATAPRLAPAPARARSRP